MPNDTSTMQDERADGSMLRMYVIYKRAARAAVAGATPEDVLDWLLEQGHPCDEIRWLLPDLRTVAFRGKGPEHNHGAGALYFDLRFNTLTYRPI